MEVIELSGYTENEKFHIAKEHLIKKQFKANGLKASQLKITDDCLITIIQNYTKEAGAQSEDHAQSQNQCKILFHFTSSCVKLFC